VQHDPHWNWKGAAVSIDLQSLRTRNGMGIGEVYDLMLLINVRELMISIPEGEGTHTRSAITYQWAKVAGLTVVQLAPIHDAWTNENDDDDSNDEKCSAPAAADAADDVLTASTTTATTTPASTTTTLAGTTATEPSEPTSFGSSWCSSLFAWHPVYISISTVLDTLRPWISHADSGLDLEQLLVRSWSSVWLGAHEMCRAHEPHCAQSDFKPLNSHSRIDKERALLLKLHALQRILGATMALHSDTMPSEADERQVLRESEDE